jgi:hypothetical protein
MTEKYKVEYLYLEEEIGPIKFKKEKKSDEEKRVEIIQIFGEEENR